VLLVVSVVALVLLNLAHLVLVLFVGSFTVLLLNEFVVDIFELLKAGNCVFLVLGVTTFLELVIVNA